MKSCLIVDDSRVIRKVARRILEAEGYACEEVADGMAALECCRASMPELVLLDWNMPVMNGLDFLKQLRAEPGGDAPVVVFCTCECEPARIVIALEAGADEYIMKPFDGDIVRAKLAQTRLAGLVEAVAA